MTTLLLRTASNLTRREVYKAKASLAKRCFSTRNSSSSAPTTIVEDLEYENNDIIDDGESKLSSSSASESLFERAIKSQVVNSLANPDSELWAAGTSSKIRSNAPAHAVINGLSKNGINDPISANANHSPSCSSKQVGIRYTHAYDDPLDEWLLNTNSRDDSVPLMKEQLNLLNVDPFELSRDEIANMTSGLRHLVSRAGHPMLAEAAEYFFGEGSVGKKVRPVMVLLLSRAMSAHDLDQNGNDIFLEGLNQRGDLFDSQRRLAEIAEMIHTASLFHDDVIDESDTRRGKPSANAVFGNKMAILAGDFLLARASICLARLRDVEVVETMSTIIEHLVRGEVMQTKSNLSVETYLKKNYYKTASLMANSCKSAAILGNYSSEVVEAAYSYGKHVGVAFQLVDDILDFEGNVDTLGKPVCADLSAGLATAPVLYAAEEFSELKPMVTRKFRGSGDVDQALKLIMKSQGIARTKDLARAHADHAIKSLMILKQSEFRDALIHLAYKVVNRTT